MGNFELRNGPSHLAPLRTEIITLLVSHGSASISTASSVFTHVFTSSGACGGTNSSRDRAQKSRPEAQEYIPLGSDHSATVADLKLKRCLCEKVLAGMGLQVQVYTAPQNWIRISPRGLPFKNKSAWRLLRIRHVCNEGCKTTHPHPS